MVDNLPNVVANTITLSASFDTYTLVKPVHRGIAASDRVYVPAVRVHWTITFTAATYKNKVVINPPGFTLQVTDWRVTPGSVSHTLTPFYTTTRFPQWTSIYNP